LGRSSVGSSFAREEVAREEVVGEDLAGELAGEEFLMLMCVCEREVEER
jgi:hypothetical protein